MKWATFFLIAGAFCAGGLCASLSTHVARDCAKRVEQGRQQLTHICVPDIVGIRTDLSPPTMTWYCKECGKYSSRPFNQQVLNLDVLGRLNKLEAKAGDK